jgi:hypothetical protein
MLKLLDTEDAWQLLVSRSGWQIEFHGAPAQRLDIEKADGGRHDIARTPGELSLREKIVEIGSNLLRGELIRGALVVGGELRDGLDILLLSAWGFAVKLHLLDHSGTSFRHSGSFACEGIQEIGVPCGRPFGATVSQCGIRGMGK